MAGFARLAFASVLAFACAAQAADIETPTTAPTGVQLIDTAQARALHARATPFYDTRSALNFGRGHIKGAAAMPYQQKSAKVVAFDPALDRFEMSLLPADKSSAFVIYSDGPTGWKSYKAAAIAARAGYSSVKWYRDGAAGWTAGGAILE
jgi:rhodanese-related sulfurtransferase